MLSAALLAGLLASAVWAADPATTAPAPDGGSKPVAAIVADWFPNSHPDVIFARVFKTYTRDGKGPRSQLRIASVYRDMPGERDQSHAYAAEYGFHVAGTVEEALTLGSGKLAVEGVLLSTEWAPYPESDTGQIVYPHRRLFEACVKVFEASGRVVPVFIDKHLADTWEDSKAIYDKAKEMKIPLMAGSRLPVTWHDPPIDVRRGAPLKEIVVASYHTLTTYGFHGLEVGQALAERRAGGETGVRSVRCLTDRAVWDAAGTLYDPALLDAALARLPGKLPEGKTLHDAVPNPILFVIEHADGLRVNVFTLNGFVTNWSAAWRYADTGEAEAILFHHEPDRMLSGFARQMKGIEEMVMTGKPAWPVERTLMTSGVLDAALISKKDGGRTRETPYLMFSYQTDWEWQPKPGVRAGPAPDAAAAVK